MSPIRNISKEKTLSFIKQIEDKYQIQCEHQTAENQTTYRPQRIKLTFTYYATSGRLLIQGNNIEMSELFPHAPPNTICPIRKGIRELKKVV